jgi:hypothetical protein
MDENRSVDINHIVNDGKHTYIKYDLGENWALYNKRLLESIFKELFERPLNIRIHNTTMLLFEGLR